jgi:Flp pilus assembly protein TadG
MRKLNQKGSVLIFLTLGFALLGTFIGFALDFGRAYLEKARINRLVDGAALAAAKILKGQAGYESAATQAACDSMVMNGADVIVNGDGSCVSENPNLTVTLSFFDATVSGGPPIKNVQVTGTEPMPTTFLRFLGFLVPGDYSTINVVATAQAGPERPVDLMLVLDRSGSMSTADGTGQSKMNSLKTAVNGFLGLSNTFSADDQIGMISFSSRGCGVNGQDSTTSTPCVPDVPLTSATSSFIAALQTKINGLVASGGTNTMEAVRTARPPMAQAFDDPSRATTRKAVLLVTDGQPTFMLRDSDSQCKHDPYTPNSSKTLTGMPAGTYASGCKHGVGNASNSPGPSLFQPLSSGGTSGLSTLTASGVNLYNDIIRCTRSMINCVTNGAMYEANLLRNCGYTNSGCTAGGEHDVLVFAIAIGKKIPSGDPQSSMDENAKCLLARMANANDILNAATGVVETMAANCNAKFTSSDGDPHNDLVEGWPVCGAGSAAPCIDPTQQKGKVYIIDVTGNVTAQLNLVFQEIAAILKLRLVL